MERRECHTTNHYLSLITICNLHIRPIISDPFVYMDNVLRNLIELLHTYFISDFMFYLSNLDSGRFAL